MRNKYNARKTYIDDIKFDSKREAERYLVLREKEKRGQIENLELQVEIELQPPFRDFENKTVRAIKYRMDFRYTLPSLDGKDSIVVWEDVKGYRTDSYKLKRKMVLYKIYLEKLNVRFIET